MNEAPIKKLEGVSLARVVEYIGCLERRARHLKRKIMSDRGDRNRPSLNYDRREMLALSWGVVVLRDRFGLDPEPAIADEEGGA